ncbi:MAG: UDP-N-acetylmuramoyl-L-alanine--D-glutamate ligase [Bdellovibrionota bacterium]
MFIPQGPVLIVGRAKSGESVASLLRATHPNLEIAFYDDDPSKSDFSDQRELFKKDWGHVVLSPGYPNQPWLRELQDTGALFTQELDIAAAYLTDEKIYAITGSVGKSTCSWIANEVLKSLSKKVFIGGNFGVPLAEYALKKVTEKKSVEFIVLELSSYQIERMAFMVDRGLILNLLPNHLDRYESLEKYYAAKLRLLRFTREGTWALDPGGDLKSFAKDSGLDSKLKWIKPAGLDSIFQDSKLIGAHNRENLAAVLEFVASPHLEERDVVNALMSVEALPHRIELFEHKGIFCVNDSKGTTIESVLTAYAAIRERYENERVFWLLGGRDKKLPWHRLKRLWADKHLSFIFFGESAAHIKKETGFEGQVFPKLAAALDHLSGKVLPGEVLVLSPGGTSLDEFKSFEDRGNFFRMTISTKF